MNVNTPKPDSMNDGQFLTVLVAFYQIEHPAENATYSVAQMIGKTEQHIKNCMANTSCLGIEQYTKIAAQAGPIAQAQFDRFILSCKKRAGIKLTH